MADIGRQKDDWVDVYAERILNSFSKWQTPLGLDHDYVQVIKKELNIFYDNPLKRSLIETTYPEEVPVL